MLSLYCCCTLQIGVEQFPNNIYIQSSCSFKKKMKKCQDWNVRLMLKFEGRTKALQMSCSVHTNIHLLKIEICKQLKLNPLETQVQIFSSGNRPLKATSSLVQNQIIRDCMLTVKIKNQVIAKNGEQSNQRSSNQAQVLEDGLSVRFYCKNQKCINFKKDSILNLGFGKFDVADAIQKIQCDVCPYKSQNLQVRVGCKDFMAKNCVYSILTIRHVQQSIFNEIKSDWVKCNIKKILTKTLALSDKQLGKIINVKTI